MLREFGLVKEMQQLGHDVKDYGDILCSTNHLSKKSTDGNLPKLPCLNDLSQASENLSKMVQTAMKDERKVLIVGGDHSIALGSVDGHMKAKNGKVCLLWVDAHADLNTADTSDTGNMHGMPVSLLVKELLHYWPYLPGFEWQQPELSIQNIAYIGLRSVDQYERFIIEKYGVSAYGMEDIEKYGIHAVTRLALEKINPDHTRSLHVSFDIDALDALEAPCTGTPVRGGLTLREAVHIMEVAHRTGWLQVVDMVEINPSIGNPQQLKITLEAAMALIKAAFGFSRSGYVPKHISKLPGFYAPIKGENENKSKSPPKDKQ
ncbi:arginase, hepatic isoform X2 [Cimex lectularius]|nr:arginase, hepatic isoform X2 [Cimex lectularius]